MEVLRADVREVLYRGAGGTAGPGGGGAEDGRSVNQAVCRAYAPQFSLDELSRFWTQQAFEHEPASAASWSNVGLIQLEVWEFLRRLAHGGRVLHVGCANGFSTNRDARHETAAAVRVRETPPGP